MRYPKIIAVDPSSSRTGVVVMNGPDAIEHAYVLDGRAAKQPEPAVAPAIAGLWRTLRIAGELSELLVFHQPAFVVVEVPNTITYRNVVNERAGGLPRYGAAVGACLHAAWYYCEGKDGEVGRPTCSLEMIPVAAWTKGRRKSRRAARTGQMVMGVKEADNYGHDVADAAGLGKYFYDQLQRREIEASAV